MRSQDSTPSRSKKQATSSASLQRTRRGFLLGGSALITAGFTSPSSGNRKDTLIIDGETARSPLIRDITEEIKRMYPSVTVTVDNSGTQLGFRRFITGNTDIQYASRPILPHEADVARRVHYENSVVVPDGIAALRQPDHWCTCMSASEARNIARRDDAEIWSELASDTVPDAENQLPSLESTTAETILVHGPRAHQYAIGTGGVSYYEIDPQDLQPPHSELTGSTQRQQVLLVRLGFIYANQTAIQHEPVNTFIQQYETTIASIIDSPPYAPSINAI